MIDTARVPGEPKGPSGLGDPAQIALTASRLAEQVAEGNAAGVAQFLVAAGVERGPWAVPYVIALAAETTARLGDAGHAFLDELKRQARPQ